MSLHRDKRHQATATLTGDGRSGLARALLFLVCCVAVWSVSRIALAYPENRALLELAVTIDMTAFVPVLYWVILVR
jgi:hypothetical protein